MGLFISHSCRRSGPLLTYSTQLQYNELKFLEGSILKPTCYTKSPAVQQAAEQVRQTGLRPPDQCLEWGRIKFTSSAHDVIAITSPQKNDLCTEELRDQAKSLDDVSLQGVVTYMSRVEAFATGIKTESSDQSPFGGPIKGSR